jgi:hypothetical protein
MAKCRVEKVRGGGGDTETAHMALEASRRVREPMGTSGGEGTLVGRWSHAHCGAAISWFGLEDGSGMA